MGASDGGASPRWVNAAFACALAILAGALQGCALVTVQGVWVPEGL